MKTNVSIDIDNGMFVCPSVKSGCGINSRYNRKTKLELFIVSLTHIEYISF